MQSNYSEFENIPSVSTEVPNEQQNSQQNNSQQNDVSFGQNQTQPRSMVSGSSFYQIPPQGDQPVEYPPDNIAPVLPQQNFINQSCIGLDTNDFIPVSNQLFEVNKPKYSNEEQLEEDLVVNKKVSPDQMMSKYRNINLGDIFELTMDSIKNPLKLSNNDQNIAVKVSLKETKIDKMESEQLKEDDEGEQATIDVFCVIDKSGSMSGPKLRNVKKSLHYLLDLLKPEDRISITTFDSTSQIILKPKLIGKSREQIEYAIDSINAGSATNVASGLERSFKCMYERKSKNQVTGVLLQSDGIDNKKFRKGGEVVDKFFKYYNDKQGNQDFTLHTFGYGNDHDEELLEQISKKGKGKFYYVEDIEKVSDNFVDCLADLTSIVGTNSHIDIFLAPSSIFPNLKFNQIYGNDVEKKNNIELRVDMKNVTKGFSKDFIFEINLEKAEDPNHQMQSIEICLANATFYTTGLAGTKYEVCKDLKVKIHNENDQVVVVEDPEIKKHLMRVKASDIISQAQACYDRQDFIRGEQILDTCCKELEEYKQDKILGSLQTNILKQKRLFEDHRQGLKTQIKASAFTKSMIGTYLNQNSIPVCGDTYETRTKQIFKSKLATYKSQE